MVHGLSVLVQRENLDYSPTGKSPPLLKERTYSTFSARWRFPQQGFKHPNCSVTARMRTEIFCAKTRHRRIRRTWAWQVS